MKKVQGFGLVETTVAVAVVGVLAVIANAGYHVQIAKSQTAEAMSLMASQKAVLIEHLGKNMNCDVDPKVFKGKYGDLVVSGVAEKIALTHTQALLKTGCNMTYTFGGDQVSSKLKGKIISANLFNNGVLSKDASTTVPESLLSNHLKPLVEDEKPTIVVVEPETDIDDSGNNEMGTTPEEVEVDAHDVTPQGQICDETITTTSDTTVVAIDSSAKYKTETTDNYHIRDGVDLKELFVQKTGRQPTSMDKVHFYVTCATAIVSEEHSKPAINVGNWPVGAELKLTNFGAILGRGGDASDSAVFGVSYPIWKINVPEAYDPVAKAIKPTDHGGKDDWAFGNYPWKEHLLGNMVLITHPIIVKSLPPKNPGDAIVNTSSNQLVVDNHKVIAGGGGAGKEAFVLNAAVDYRPGGGAPYGRGGIGYPIEAPSVVAWQYVGGNASFSTPGNHSPGFNSTRNGRYGSNGANWGEESKDPTDVHALTYYLKNHLPGYYSKGYVLINNIGEGYIKGRAE